MRGLAFMSMLAAEMHLSAWCLRNTDAGERKSVSGGLGSSVAATTTTESAGLASSVTTTTTTRGCPAEVSTFYTQLKEQPGQFNVPAKFLPLFQGHMNEASNDERSLAKHKTKDSFAGNGLRYQYGGALRPDQQRRLYLMQWAIIDKFFMPEIMKALQAHPDGHYLVGGIALNYFLDQAGKLRPPTEDIDLAIRPDQKEKLFAAMDQLLNSSTLSQISQCFASQDLANITGYRILDRMSTYSFQLLSWTADGASYTKDGSEANPAWLFLDTHGVSYDDNPAMAGGDQGGKFPVVDLETELWYVFEDPDEFKWYKAHRRAMRLLYVQEVAPELFVQMSSECRWCSDTAGFATGSQVVPKGPLTGKRISIKDGSLCIGDEPCEVIDVTAPYFPEETTTVQVPQWVPADGLPLPPVLKERTRRRKSSTTTAAASTAVTLACVVAGILGHTF